MNAYTYAVKSTGIIREFAEVYGDYTGTLSQELSIIWKGKAGNCIETGAIQYFIGLVFPLSRVPFLRMIIYWVYSWAPRRHVNLYPYV